MQNTLACKFILLIGAFALNACATARPEYDASSFETKVKQHPICKDGKQVETIKATFAIYEGVPSGREIASVEKEQIAYNQAADQLIVSFFYNFAQVVINRDTENIRYNSIARPTIVATSLITLGITGAIYAMEPENFIRPELRVTSPVLKPVHLVLLSTSPLEFAICQNSCEGLENPLHGGKISDVGHDPLGRAVLQSGIYLHALIGSSYFDRRVATPEIVSKSVKGAWKIVQNSIDFQEFCGVVREKTELYTD